MLKLLLDLAFEISFPVEICEPEASVALALNQVAGLQSSVGLNCEPMTSGDVDGSDINGRNWYYW